MRYVERDAAARKKAFLVVFAVTVAGLALINPCQQVGGVAVLGVIAGLLAATILGAYQAYLDHLSDELTDRRSQRMAALAIED